MRKFPKITNNKYKMWEFQKYSNKEFRGNTNKYRSVQELRSSSKISVTFDLILFLAVNFEFIVEKVWFG